MMDIEKDLNINHKTLNLDTTIKLENGETLSNIQISYTTIGNLNDKKDNVIWVFHALTGNSNPIDWWGSMFVKNTVFNPKKHFIICANILGSCYGTTSPQNFSFPLFTINDMVQLHIKLKEYLKIEKIKFGIGGSLGGQQLLEWAVEDPDLFDYIFPIATNAVHSPWGIAFNEAQRMALDNADMEKGIQAARALALLSYRSYKTFELTQNDENFKSDNFRASSYIRYQGKKLADRFTYYSYYYLSKAMDSHNVGRKFNSIPEALKRIKAKTLIIGIKSDILFPFQEQEFLSNYIPNSKLELIDSNYGHDGFLIETNLINSLIKKFYKE